MNYDPKSTAILLSLKPEYYPDIFNGDKVLELRKSVPREFGSGWVYIYITKSKPLLYITGSKDALNGKVVARFWFDEYDTYSIEKPVKNIMVLILNKQNNSLGMDWFTYENLVNKSCVDIDAIWDYAKLSKNSPDKQRWVYAWHIKQLETFDKPLSLSDFGIKRSPQSWQYVWIGDELELIKE